MNTDMHYRATMENGNTGWRARLQDVYSTLEEFEAFDEVYGLLYRLTNDWSATRQQVWERNPVIQGSTNPDDYCISDLGDVIRFILAVAGGAVAADAAQEEARGLALVIADCPLSPNNVASAVTLVNYLASARLDGEVYDKRTGKLVDGDAWDLRDAATDALPEHLEEHVIETEALAEKYRDIIEDCRMFKRNKR